MAYLVPTAADLKARFPGFAAVDDAVVTAAIDEAALLVDNSWSSQATFTLGRMLVAAHILTLDGHGTGAESEIRKAGGSGFQRFKSASLDLWRYEPARAGGRTALTSDRIRTAYSDRFDDLLAREKGGPIVVNPGARTT